MSNYRLCGVAIVAAVCAMAHSDVSGQIVINEVMKEERSISGGLVANAREFVELYNAGSTAVDLNNWSLVTYDIAANSPASSYTITGVTTILQPGDYFVIGDTGVPGVDLTPPGAPVEMWPDIVPNALVLRNGPDPFSGTVVDAVAYDVYRNGANGVTLLPAEITGQIGSGFEGSPISPNAASGQTRISWGRYRDGVDSNKNGIDFGTLPLTPGATNNTLPQNAAHTVPNADSFNVGDSLPNQYYGAFELGRVIDPTVATANLNPRAIPASPQGGKAIVAWDHTGGGNSVYSKELVNKFDLYAYVDTDLLGVAASTADREYESAAYGIGSIDPLFENPDPEGVVAEAEPGFGAATRNGSSGVGWLFNQFETENPADGATPDHNRLYLVDFGDTGNSRPAANDWVIHAEIDLTQLTAGWQRLGIEYNPSTDEVTGRFGNQTFTFTINYDLVGTFYVGYREGITGAVGNNLAKHNPPIYDLFVAPGLPGDFNSDNKVDAADYVTWRKNEGANAALPNDNGLATQAGRFALWRANFGNPGAGGGLGTTAIPEPTSLLLVLTGVAIAAARRTRRAG